MQNLKRNFSSLAGAFVLLLIVIGAKAQSGDALQTKQIDDAKPNPLPPSPNIASLGKFIEYPIGYFSGIPDISIPIYEVKSGGLTVPITLSYHASGVKPTDVASWVGMGWSLSTGGNISRNVRGKPDEQQYYTSPLETSLSVCSDLEHIIYGNYAYMSQIASGSRDADPDIYTYSFPGASGQFILRPPPKNSTTNPPAFLIPYAPYIVSKVNVDQFEVTSSNGVLYRYGTGSDDQIVTEGTTALSGGVPSFSGTTAWHLREIIAPNSNDQITFNYQDNGTSTTADRTGIYNVSKECMSRNPQEQTQAGCPTLPEVYNEIDVTSDTNQEAVSEILFKTGKVKFILANDPRLDYVQQSASSGPGKALSQIIIYSKNADNTYDIRKSITFVYSYFLNNNTSDTNEALKLDEVRIQDKSANTIQRYKFTYTTNSFSWNRNVASFWRARDKWGYYNGANNMYLTDSVLSGGVSPNREVNLQYVQEGVLQRIDYPTGGFTAFEYESNEFEDMNNQIRYCGGLRVKKMTSYDGASKNIDGTPKVIIKSYQYGEDNSGIGKQNFNESQNSYHNTQAVFTDCYVQESSASYILKTYSSNSAFSLDPFDNSPVRYNYVTEYFGDYTAGSQSTNTTGRVEYIYDGGRSDNDFNEVVANSTKYFPNSSSWRRGNLTQKTTYDASNRLIAKSVTTYQTLNEQTDVLVGWGVFQYIAGNNLGCSGAYRCQNEAGDSVNVNTFNYARYTQSTGTIVESQTSEYVYEPGTAKAVVTTTVKVYDGLRVVPISQTVTRSNNKDDEFTRFVYPFQIGGNSSSIGSAFSLYRLTQKNICSTPIETYVALQDKGTTFNRRVISSKVTTYKINPNNLTQIVPDQIYFLDSPVPITDYNPVRINDANTGLTMNSALIPRLSIDNYDADGNVTSFKKVNDVTTSYKYSYHNSLPVLQAINASDTEVKIEDFESIVPGTYVKYVPATAHTGDQYYLGQYTTSFSPPGGKSYLIDYWYLDTNGNWNFIKKSYTGSGMICSEGVGIDDVRVYPTTALVTSYSYDPIFGKESETDTNGRMVFYEYDDFGRLKNIRDTDRNILKTYDYQYTVKLK